MIKAAFRWCWDLVFGVVNTKPRRDQDLEADLKALRESGEFEELWIDVA